MKTENQLATERAIARVGPRPKYEPFPAAILGAIAAAGVVYLFRFIVVPDPDHSGYATLGVVAMVFAVVFGYFWSAHRKYNNAWAEEYLKITPEDPSLKG